MLRVEKLSGGYGEKIIVRDVSMKLKEGELVSIIGHNGAGKTTLLRLLFGLLTPSNGQIIYEGNQTKPNPMYSVEHRIAFMSESNNIFPELTVEENLQLAGHSLDKKSYKEQREKVLTLFPILKDKWETRGGRLSGGQRQMLALGIGLMQRPKLLLLDEPSVGLAPAIVDNVMESLSKISKELNISVLVVEQNVTRVLEVSQYTYVMKLGKVIKEGTPKEILREESLWDLF